MCNLLSINKESNSLVVLMIYYNEYQVKIPNTIIKFPSHKSEIFLHNKFDQHGDCKMPHKLKYLEIKKRI